jgi:chitobiase/beta-hexosaminidase-like protein
MLFGLIGDASPYCKEGQRRNKLSIPKAKDFKNIARWHHYMPNRLCCKHNLSRRVCPTEAEPASSKNAFRQAVYLTLFVLLVAPIGRTQVSVLTQHNDIARDGQNTNETILTPTNVNSQQFGKLFSLPVDGQVYAQPLYLYHLTIPGRGIYNVVFVATEHDSVYAFDADSNAGFSNKPLWHISLLDQAHGAAPGATTVPYQDVGTNNLAPEIGITSTPVIDPATKTLYVSGKTKENGVAIQRLHALNLTTGAEKFAGPVTLQASVPGVGNGSSAGILKFDAWWHHNRAGLLLLNGVVYMAFGSFGDNNIWHGWIMAYDAATLKQTGVFCDTANGTGSGIWMSGSGLAADVPDPKNHPFGRMFVPTGNGSFSATPPYKNSMNYGNDMLSLDLTNGIPTVVDSFTPHNQQTLDNEDLDISSGGTLLLPDQTSGGHTHLLVQVGKPPTIYVIDRDKMGGYSTSTDNIVQEITGKIQGIWNMPAYWNNHVYFWASQDYLKSFSLTNGRLSTSPTSVAPTYSDYPGSTPSISSNGTADGIVWTVETDGQFYDGPAILHANLATNVATVLYTSSQDLSRDNPGNAVKFVVPTIANGKVYVGTQNQVSVYGLLNGEVPAPPTVLSPNSTDFYGSIRVTISATLPGATIYYTTDGSNPTTGSKQYSLPLTLTVTTTIKSIATLPGYLSSAVTSENYTLKQPQPGPVGSERAGKFPTQSR